MNELGVMKNSAAFALMHRDAAENRIYNAYLIVSDDELAADILCSMFLADCVFGVVDRDSVAKVERTGADIIRLPHGEKFLTADAEELVDTVYYTPTELSRKYYVISHGETMNEPSQNKLLKVLEEPPTNVVIIIKCTRVKTLLPTVLSRVKRVDVAALSYDTVLEFLRSRYGEDNNIYLAAALGNGFLGRADKAMNDPTLPRIYALAIDTLKNMKNSRMVLSFSVRIAVFKDNLSDFVDILELIFGDCLLCAAGVRDRLKFKNGIKDIIDISAEYTAEVVVKLRPVLMRAKRRLELNGNPQSVLDELLFSILEVKAKCRKL